MRRSSLVRAIVDTNVLFSGLISTRGAPFEIIELWRAGRLQLVASEEIAAEYQRVLARPAFTTRFAFSEAAIEAVLGQLREAERVIVESAFDIPTQCRDPKDQMYLVAAVAGGVQFLVSGDDDILACAGDPGLESVQIVRPREFLQWVTERPDDPAF